MTQASNPVLTGSIRRRILILTLPLIAAELLQQLYNTVDSLIIGHYLGTGAFAATGIAGSIMNLFIFILSGFCIGVSILFSSKFGAGDFDGFRKVHFTAISFGSLFTIALSLLCILLTGPVLRLVDTPEELMDYCRRYLFVILGGLLATYLNNLFTSILRSVGESGSSLVFLTVSLISNTLLDLLFVAVFPWGIIGAAAATVAAQAISALCCYIYLLRRYPELIFKKKDAGVYTSLIRQLFSYGASSALHMSSLYIGKLLVQGVVDTCGTSVIAAFTAATRIEAFINAPGNGFAQAESVFIAQNLAAGNRERVRDSMKESLRLIMGCGLVLAVTLYFASPYALRLFLKSDELLSLSEGTAYLKIIFFFYVLSYGGYYFVGTARGYGKMKVPFFATTLQLTVRVILSYLLIGRLGLSAVAWATGIGWIFVVGFHYLSFRRYARAELSLPPHKTAV